MDPVTYLSSAPCIALILCVAWSFVVGFIWYSRPVFGEAWMNLCGLKMSDEQMKSGMGRAMGLEAVSSLLLAYSLSYLASLSGASSLVDHLWIGGVVAIGIGIKGLLSRAAWEQSSLKLVWLNGGAMLLTVLGMCVILAKMN